MQPPGSSTPLDTWYFYADNDYASLTMCPIIASNVVQTSGTTSPTFPGLTFDNANLHVSVIDTHNLATFEFYAYVKFEGGPEFWQAMTLEVICGATSTVSTISGAIPSPQIFEATSTQAGDHDIFFSVPRNLFASTNPVCPVSNFTTSVSSSSTSSFSPVYVSYGNSPFNSDWMLDGPDLYSNATHWNFKVTW